MKDKLSLVKDYIVGNDIEGYSFEELENDSEFMFEVLKQTQDIKMYDFCSDNLKKDPVFNKEVIILFRKNIKFIAEVSKNVIANMDDDNELLNDEFLITVKEVLLNNRINEKRYLDLSLNVGVVVTKNKLFIDWLKEEEELSDIIDMGFLAMQVKYNYSEIVNQFYAKKFIKEIFEDKDGYRIEEILHANFNNYDKVMECGINNFLLNYIRYKDYYLADYVSCNIDMLDKYKNNLDEIKDSWDFYDIKLNYDKFLTLESIIDSNRDEYKAVIVDTIHIMNAVVDELNLYDEFNDFMKYYDMNKTEVITAKDIYIEDEKVKKVLNENLTFAGKALIKKCIEDAKEIFKDKYPCKIEPKDNYIYEEKKAKIMKIDFKNIKVGNNNE